MEAPRHVLVKPPIDAVATLKALMEAAAARGTQPGPAEAGAVTPAVTPPASAAESAPTPKHSRPPSDDEDAGYPPKRARPEDDGLAGLLAC